MAELTGTISVKYKGAYSDSPDIGILSHAFAELFSNTLTNGTGANQANTIFSDNRSISGNDDIDLAGGLTDSFGNTLTYTSVKAIIIKAADANSANIIMGAEGANPFATIFNDATDAILIPPGGMFVLTNPAADGFAVTAGTGDILRFAPASGTQAFDLIIIGEV